MNNQERLIKLTESIEKTKEIIRLNKNLGESTVIDYWELWLDQQESARNELIEQIKQEEKSMKVVTAEDISRIFTEMEKKYGKDKAIGIFVGTTQESVRLIDGKSATQILFEKLQEYENKEKETKVEDRDVVFVDGFLSALDNIQKQMSLITDHKYRDVILDVKLRRVFDWYKDKMELKSLDSLKDFYFRRQVK